MINKNSFIPEELKDKESFFLFGTMSTAYWDFAVKMETMAMDEFSRQPASLFVFPAIIFYCASFEALLNEGLTKILLYDKSNEDEIIKIKAGQKEYGSIEKKIKICASYLDRKKQGVLKDNIIKEYIALAESRNAIIHYNPEYGSIYNYPPRLLEAFKLSKSLAIEGADWVETFKTNIVLSWAKKTAMNMINCFLDFQLEDKKEFYGTQFTLSSKRRRIIKMIRSIISKAINRFHVNSKYQY
jgi:hypothetical protein